MKQAERRAKTREQILDAADQLFADRGVDGTTIDDIVEAADLARGTFYYNFKTKDEVVVALARRDLRKQASRTLKKVDTDGSAIEALRELLSGACRWYKKNRHLAETVLTYPYRNPEVMTDQREDESSFRHITFEIIQRGQQRQELRDDIDAASLSQILIGVFLQATFFWIHHPQAGKLDEWIDQFLTVYLEGAKK